MKGEQIMYEVFEQLLQKYGVTPYKLSKETGIAQATFSDWKNGRSTPKQEKLQKIADYFGVTIEYLMTGKEQQEKEPALTPKEERDIAKKLNEALEQLQTTQKELMFDGIILDDNTRELLKISLENSIRLAKQIAKKYTPKKHK